jgi:general secretion pathway protein L
MSAPGKPQQWGAALQAGWHRLREALAALVPAAVRERLTRGGAVVAIDLDGETVRITRFADGAAFPVATLARAGFNAGTLRAALGSYLAKPRLLRDSFALRLPDGVALKRNLSLPLAARHAIGSLLDLELDRQSPIDSSQIYHDYRILRVDRQAGRLDLAWRIVRRRTVDPAIEVCREAGIDLAVIAFVSDETPPDGGTFPVDSRAARLLGARRWILRGLILLILVLLLAVTAGAYARNQQALDDLATRVDQARVEARASLQLEHEIAALRARSQRLAEEKRQPSVTRMLAQTTRLLPTGTWLTGFAYSRGEVRLQGYSSAAPSLIGLFDASPLFTAAEFRAPLVQAQGPGLEQFDLALKVRGSAP